MAENINDVDITISPYSITIESEKEKGYKKVYFKEGMAIQGQELNNNNAYQDEINKKIMEYNSKKDGTIVKGSGLNIDGTSITIPSDVEIWMDGQFVTKSTPTTLTITGVGNETIGAILTKEIYHASDDSDLLDPSTSYLSSEGVVEPQNAGNPGAARVKYSISYALTGYDYALWFFKDGILQNPDTAPYSLDVMAEVEQRHDNVSGSHSVKAIGAFTSPYDDENSNLTIPSNTFYVRGKKVNRIQDQRILIPHATSTELVNNEQQPFATGTLEYPTNEYPVKDVSDFTFIQEGYIEITRGSVADTSDTVCSGTSSGNPVSSMNSPFRGSLYQLLEVYEAPTWDGVHTKDYTIGSDPDDDCYKDGNNINWSHLSGNGADEPVTGGSYFAKVRVTTNAILGVRTKSSATNETINNGGNATKDLAHNDVFNVVIGDTLGASDYVEGTDFRIVNNLTTGYTNSDPNTAGTESDYAYIEWLGTPPAGTIYVSYNYWVHTKEGHYVARNSFSNIYEPAINTEEIDDYANTGYRRYVSFNTSSAEKPVDASTFSYDYNVFRGRKDIIEVLFDPITKTGDFARTEGAPAEESKYPIGHYDAVTIVKLDLPPDSPLIVCHNQPVYSRTQKNLVESEVEIAQIKDQLAQLILTVDREGKFPRISSKRGEFFEGCIDLRPTSRNGGDTNYNRGGISFNSRYNIDEGYLTLPRTLTTPDLTPDLGSSTVTIGTEKITLNSSISSIANTPQELKNTLGSTTMSINPYTTFDKAGPFIEISPNSDQWIYEEVSIQDTDSRLPINTTGGFDWGTDYTVRVMGASLVQGLTSQWGESPRPWIDMSPGARGGALTVSGRTTPVQNPDVTRKSTVTFARGKTITVTGYLWQSLEDNIRVQFDDTEVSLTPTGTTVAGTTTGTVKAKSDGTFTATFVIPSSMPTGDIPVIAYGLDSNSVATANYKCGGITKLGNPEFVWNPPVMPPFVTTQSNLTPQEIRMLDPRRTSPLIQGADGTDDADPLGQELLITKNYDIKKIVLYFKTKDVSLGGFVQIKRLQEGDPEYSPIANISFTSAQVSTSTNGATATEITLDEPVSLNANEQYLLVIGTNSDNYEVFVTEANGTDTVTGEKITGQTHLGNLRSSSNGLSWTIHQTQDLKFIACPNVYSSSGSLFFNNVTVDCTSFMVLATQLLRFGTSTKWWYSTDNGSTWRGFSPNTEVKLGDQASQIKIMCDFTTTDSYTSPVLINNVVLLAYNNSSSGRYITRNIEFVAGKEYYKTSLSADVAIPSGTSITGYISPDDGTNWVAIGSPTEETQIDGEWTQYNWEVPFNLAAPQLAANDLSATTGGVLANATYYYKISATNAHGETLPSVERSITLSGADNAVLFDLTGVFPTGATGYRVYRSTSTNTETLKYIKTSIDTSFTDTGADTNAVSTTPKAVADARDYKDNWRLRFDFSTSALTTEPKVAKISATME